MKLHSLDLNYDIELKIQGRVHSGKLKLTVERQVKFKWEHYNYNKCWSTKFYVLKIFKPWTFIAFLVRRQRMGDFLFFVGFESAKMTNARPFSSFANLEFPFHCASRSFLAFLLNQNVESPNTKLCSADKTILFPQHFFFPGK